jgi:hypothetical protein
MTSKYKDLDAEILQVCDASNSSNIIENLASLRSSRGVSDDVFNAHVSTVLYKVISDTTKIATKPVLRELFNLMKG